MNSIKGGAIQESHFSNARYAIRNGDRGEGEAITESPFLNARNIIRNGNGSEGTTIESIISNARYAIGDGNGGEGGATRESIISNARYAVRNDCILTASNKGICRYFNNCVAVVAAIVFGITSFYYHRGEGAATTESTYSNARNAIRDGNRGEG